jgi:rhodanese-related sulfurtransferase
MIMKEYFHNFGFEIDGMLHLTGKQALECLQQGAVLVDLREEFETGIKDFDIPVKLFCPLTDFDTIIVNLPKDQPIILADCVGIHSKEAVAHLMAQGFQMVANLIGGIYEWERSGLPMKKPDNSISGQCPCVFRLKKI